MSDALERWNRMPVEEAEKEILRRAGEIHIRAPADTEYAGLAQTDLDAANLDAGQDFDGRGL